MRDGFVQDLPCSRAEKTACANANQHAFFDPFHVSERVHFLWAKRCLKDLTICSPLNLVQLLKA